MPLDVFSSRLVPRLGVRPVLVVGSGLTAAGAPTAVALTAGTARAFAVAAGATSPRELSPQDTGRRGRPLPEK